MMLRNLIDEVVRPRLWPILALAVLVAVAAAVVFLKSAPSDGPVAAAPAPAPAGKLPARAQRLLATNRSAERGGAPRTGSGSAGDPFQPPSSQAKQSVAASSKTAPDSAGAGAGGGATTEPVPVVITNADGSKPPSSTSPGDSAPATPIGDDASATAPTNVAKRAVAVDVRFGEQLPGRVHRAIPRMQTFVAGGRVIAVFVKYSPKREKAVFAIAPSTLVTGDVDCRRKGDVCRYVDVPAGKHVRLTTLSSDGALVSRRLDVMRIGRAPGSGATAAAAGGAPQNGSCLLGKLLTLDAGDAPLADDACRG